MTLVLLSCNETLERSWRFAVVGVCCCCCREKGSKRQSQLEPGLMLMVFFSSRHLGLDVSIIVEKAFLSFETTYFLFFFLAS